jgi:chromosome segregation ATPase
MDKTQTRGRRNGSPTGTEHTQATIGSTQPAAVDAATTARDEEIAAAVDDLATDALRARIALTPAAAGIDKRVPQAVQDAFLDERNDVMSVINELEDQLDRHQEIREALERELATASDKLHTSDQKLQELEWKVAALQTRVDAAEKLKLDIASYEEEIADANARAVRATDQLTEIEKDRARIKNELKSALKQIEELWAVKKERDGLRADSKSLSVKLAELERTSRDAIEERAALTGRLQEAQAGIEELRTEKHQLTISLRSAEDRVKELLRLQESLSDKVESIRAEKKSLQAQIVHLERENTRMIEQRQFYETELTSLRNINRSSDAALSSLKKAFAEVRVALTETKTRARRRTLEPRPRYSPDLRDLDVDPISEPAAMPLTVLDPRPSTTTLTPLTTETTTTPA